MRQLGITHMTGPYPAYINVSEGVGYIAVTVRSPAKDDGSCGDYGLIRLTREQWGELVDFANQLGK